MASRKQLQSVADEGWREIRQDAEERFDAYNARGVEDAVNSGLLELHTFEDHTVEGMLSMTHEGHTVKMAVEDILWEYVEKAQVAVDGRGYPLFDDLMSRLVEESVKEGLIVPSPAGVHRGRHGGLTGNLLSRLPLFEQATVSEVLEIRQEIEYSLRGFRTAVSDFSRQVESAAWEPGFVGEADVLFQEKVEPEVEKIEEDVRENSSLQERLRAYGPGVTTAGGASVGAFLGSGSALGAMAALAAGLPAAAWQGVSELRKKRQGIENNQLYFYYQASEALRRGD